MTAASTVQVPSFSGYGGATLHLAIDPAEHERRQAAGIGPVTGHGFGGLDHLMALPAGLPVPVSELTEEQQKYVRQAPAAICTIDDGQVTRHAIRPCRVVLATVESPSAGKLALNSAGRFAPFCPRRVVIRRLPHRKHFNYLADYDFYGVGVTLQHPDGTTEPVLDPAPWRPKRHTPAGWWFAERAYTEYLQHTATNPAGAAA
ncbi:hypothetical protein [Streptomyces violaceusniger]|uniref:hypothetical protein n=1 Tax=Streptomyces violaceusniger TaxID=68280 RepID=UPI0037FBE16E